MDQDSVQCLESSLIEENLPPEIDTAGPAASATNYTPRWEILEYQ